MWLIIVKGPQLLNYTYIDFYLLFARVRSPIGLRKARYWYEDGKMITVITSELQGDGLLEYYMHLREIHAGLL